MCGSRVGFVETVLLAISLAAVTGCQPPPEPVDDSIPSLLSRLPYPAHAQATDLDIVVTRQDESLVLTNRTASTHRGVMVWLNQQYVWGPVDIPIALEYRLNLRGFINQHRESYPVGGPLTPDKSMPLTLAELYAASAGAGADDKSADGAGVRYRLLVRQDEASRGR
jgi:hypothetical protein